VKRTYVSHDISFGILSGVFENAPDIAVSLLSGDYSVLWANKLMVVVVQKPLHEIIGRPCYEVWRRRQVPCPICPMRTLTETKRPHVRECWFDPPGKERLFAEMREYPVLDAQGLVMYMFQIVIPITKRKKDEKRHRDYVASLERTIMELNASRTASQEGVDAENEGARLTPRQIEVLQLVARGFSNKEIAGILQIRFDTVKTHIKNIFFKLNVKDRTQAAVWAASRGSR
jgi:DNA-binding CsgD family transcriptional regulator